MASITTGMKIQIASLPDKEKVVAELSYQGEGWAIVSQEEGPLVIDIYSNLNKETWTFEIDELLLILQEAKRRLIEETA